MELGRGKRYPESHAAFLARCREAGQQRSPVILIHYQAPAVNELHRDVWGELTFPLQLAVTLSGRDGISGGEFVLADQGPGKGAQRHEIATARGDGILFCTRDRLVRHGEGHALQGVVHGMAPLSTGERYVLGCPFHDYRGRQKR